jgi:hypothetical protein
MLRNFNHGFHSGKRGLRGRTCVKMPLIPHASLFRGGVKKVAAKDSLIE